MTKEEAAVYLGVSSRTLERYTKQGKIEVTYDNSKNRPISIYDKDDLDRLRDEMGISTIKPVVDSFDLSLQPASQLENVGVFSMFFNPFRDLMERVISALEVRNDSSNKISVPIGDKLLLTLPEVQALTGLSRDLIKKAIDDGDLPSKIMGKAFRIKRSDLEKYINNLWL